MMDPTRLREDPNLAAEERALLEVGREAYPYDVAAGAMRFRTSLAALGAAAAVSTASTTAQGAASLGGKIAVKTLASIVLPLACVVGVGALLVATRGAPSPTVPRTPDPPANVALSKPTVAPPVAKAIPFEALPELPAGDPSAEDKARSAKLREGAPTHPRGATHEHVAGRLAETNAAEARPLADPIARDEQAPEEPSANAAPKPKEAAPKQEEAAPKPPEPAPRTQSDTATEMLTIARARQLLASNPGAALSLLESERKIHPHGLFAEERSALTIIALAKTGNLALARAQAKVFIGAHPRGPLTDQVRTATGL